ncbi:ion channel CASTOR isoform X5 [Cryptomeria japonica]|uniref:ion channel CASTOR isoform X5 n=1 Tax=Cryptomeria japonica TaxID=3369 RepID=UPI0027DA767E|nr:ion channel CASTOR isoform X5 [Cryptomeria japonica]
MSLPLPLYKALQTTNANNMAYPEKKEAFGSSRDWYFPSSLNTDSVQRSPFRSYSTSSASNRERFFRPTKSQRIERDYSVQRTNLGNTQPANYGRIRSDILTRSDIHIRPDAPSHEFGGGGSIHSLRRRRPSNPSLPVQQVVENLQVNFVGAESVKSKFSASKLTSYRPWPLGILSFKKFLLPMMFLFSLLYVLLLREQLATLEEELKKLQIACDGQMKYASDDMQSNDASYDRDVRNFALCVVIFLLSIPFLFFKYIDDLPWLTRAPRNNQSLEEAPLSKRIAYGVDVFFSTYSYAKPLALLFATILLIGVGGLALFAVSDDSFLHAMWMSWTYVADSGNHTSSVGMGPRIVSVSISFGGMLIFAMMLGLVSDAISEKVDSLRKGKSEVIESNHTLILGWSDKLASLLNQLAIANQSLGGGVVVVLAERDKEEMEMDITKMEFDFMGTSVICRSGSPLIMADLKKVSVSKARSIIVLAEDENADQSDAHALRVVLSLIGVKEGLRGHIVVEMSDLDNEPLVKLVGGDLVETVVAHDVIGRLMIQCARQPGLAQIWENVLGFEGAEFYIKRWPELDGMQFEDVLISFPDAIPCGVKVAKGGGNILLNPDDDYVLREGDEILVIAEDDDSYAPGPLPEVLDAFLAPSSELWMFNRVSENERDNKLIVGGLDPSRLENITLVHREGNAAIRRHLESLPLETFDAILILADESMDGSVVQADSQSLATLLLIRDIQSKRLPLEANTTQVHQTNNSENSWIGEMQQASVKSIIISEILDSRTKNLLTVSRISDYVLSNELVSMALAMVAEDRQINCVLEELFSEEGNEMYIRRAEFYLDDQEELNFYEIMVRARQRREIAIGYRLASADQPIINPPDKGTQRRWSVEDYFVVLAEDE